MSAYVPGHPGADMETEEESGKKLDEEHGVPQEKAEKKVRFEHDVSRLDVCLDTLTSGAIDWEKAADSLQWMVDKTKQALEDHKENIPEISQFLAKTCVMHTIQCFHHCRTDAAPGFAHEGESSPTQPPSATESRTKSDIDDHSSPPSPST